MYLKNKEERLITFFQKLIIISRGVDRTPTLRRLKYHLRLRKANLDRIKKAKPNRTTTTLLLLKISP